MKFLQEFKEGWDRGGLEFATVPRGVLAELAAQPLPEVAGELFEACFAEGKPGWTKGLSHDDVGRAFLEPKGWKGEQDYIAQSLLAEALQLLEHNRLLALYLTDAAANELDAKWCVTRAGRAAAKAGTVQRDLVAHQ
ncbi:MAG: hypothetical protein M3R70_02215 [Actinomycetota bacterium]|nr:hypothetical protein [Actinomycetota bacterium]